MVWLHFQRRENQIFVPRSLWKSIFFSWCYLYLSLIIIVMNFFSIRCVCFDGPPCPDYIEDPCQTFIPPPPTPDKFTMYYNSKLTVCSPMGCKTTYSSGRELQSLTDLKKRDDYGSIYWSSTFVLPRPGGGFNQVRRSLFSLRESFTGHKERWEWSFFLYSISIMASK